MNLFHKFGPLTVCSLSLMFADYAVAASEDETRAGDPERFRPSPRGAPDSRVGAGTRYTPDIDMEPRMEQQIDQQRQFRRRVEPEAAPAAPPPPAAPINPFATEQALGLSREQRRAVQQALTDRGFDTQGVDGVFGRNTRFAIRAFQEASGFEPTGFLTGAQVELLLAE